MASVVVPSSPASAERPLGVRVDDGHALRPCGDGTAHDGLAEPGGATGDEQDGVRESHAAILPPQRPPMGGPGVDSPHAGGDRPPGAARPTSRCSPTGTPSPMSSRRPATTTSSTGATSWPAATPGRGRSSARRTVARSGSCRSSIRARRRPTTGATSSRTCARSTSGSARRPTWAAGSARSSCGSPWTSASAPPTVTAVLIDPLASNTRARAFYERLGFVAVGPRRFGTDDCVVYRLDRAAGRSGAPVSRRRARAGARR